MFTRVSFVQFPGEQGITKNSAALPVFLLAGLTLSFRVVGLILPLSCISIVAVSQKAF